MTATLRPRAAIRSAFKSIKTAAAAFSLFLAAALSPSAAAAAPRDATDQIIVKFRSESGTRVSSVKASRMAALSAISGKSLSHKRIMSGGAHVLKLPSRSDIADVEAAARRISADPDVEYAVPDRIAQPTAVPNDPSYANQWHYKADTDEIGGADLPGAWDITTGGANVVVAVIDTGLRPHADISPARILPGYDMITDLSMANDGGARDADPADPGNWVAADECYAGSAAKNSDWHGTHVTGTIGAATDNGLGAAGINWNSKILPVRVLGKCGGYSSDIIDGIRWAAGLPVSGVPNNANPARIINMSLGGDGACPAPYQAAIDDAVAAGAAVIVAAGNSDMDASEVSPASCANVITVAATDRTGGRAFYSNFGVAVDIAAPGGETSPTLGDGVLSTLNTGIQGPLADTYAYYQGTSMAAPHVAGIASLLISARPGLTPAQITSILTTTARTFPTGTGSDCAPGSCGAGIVNAAAALRYDGYEPDDDSAGAATLASGVQQTHSLVPTGDTDWFTFTLPAASSVTIRTSGPAASDDTEMWLYDSSAVQISSNDDESLSSYWSQITAPALAAGTYLVKVSEYGNNGEIYPYYIDLTAVSLPAPPADFTATARGVSSVTWTWDSVAGASEYRFYPSTGGAAITLTSPALTQAQLSTNTAYGGRVSAVNAAGESALSAAVAVYTLAAPPVSQAAAWVGVSSAAANWAPNQNPAGTFFTLELSADNFSSVLASSRTTLGTAAFSALLSNTSYYFRVRAENGQGIASAHAPAIATVTFAAPPYGLTLTQFSSAALVATWPLGSNAADTRFELTLSSSDFFTNISTPLPFSPASAVTQAALAGLTAGTTYYAKVRAQNRLGFTTAFSTASYYIPFDVTLTIDPALQATVALGNATLEVPPQSFTQAVAVTLQLPGSFPPAASLAASLTGVNAGVEITTDKVVLPLKRLTLTLAYSAAQAAGLDESRFIIARYEPARAVWVPYASTPDPAANQVTALIDHLSLFQVMMATPAGSLASAAIKIFPNPVHPSRGQALKFTGLPAGATIKLYTFHGELVRELTADAGGIAQWDVRNSWNRPVASEVYLALIKAGGETKVMKVMVER